MFKRLVTIERDISFQDIWVYISNWCSAWTSGFVIECQCTWAVLLSLYDTAAAFGFFLHHDHYANWNFVTFCIGKASCTWKQCTWVVVSSSNCSFSLFVFVIIIFVSVIFVSVVVLVNLTILYVYFIWLQLTSFQGYGRQFVRLALMKRLLPYTVQTLTTNSAILKVLC